MSDFDGENISQSSSLLKRKKNRAERNGIFKLESTSLVKKK